MSAQPTSPDEPTRAARLVQAQGMAVELFEAIVDRGLIVPGISERELSDAIRDLAGDLLGVRRYWHKRVVRAGVNTLQPYRENPPDRVIEADDIVFCDFGPLLEQWEADFGRTYVLGEDPVKHRLCRDLAVIFDQGRQFFEADPDVSGEQLYQHVAELARAAGWQFGNVHAGHLVGEFPHETIDGEQIESYIAPGSSHPMRRLDRTGRQAHWILEVHLVDPERQFGGFYEELLDLGHPIHGSRSTRFSG